MIGNNNNYPHALLHISLQLSYLQSHTHTIISLEEIVYNYKNWRSSKYWTEETASLLLYIRDSTIANKKIFTARIKKRGALSNNQIGQGKQQKLPIAVVVKRVRSASCVY